MKKAISITLALLLILTLAACGGRGAGESATNTPPTDGGSTAAPDVSTSVNTDNGGATTDTGGKLNPPEWFIGTWEGDTDTNNEIIEVTVNNVTVSSGNLDFTWQIENVGLEVAEKLDGDTYSLEYTLGVKFVYTFVKQEDGAMKRTVTMGDVVGPLAVFTRQ